MNHILLNLQAKLAEITDFKYVDEDWGQLDYYSSRPPVGWPACLIDITGASFTDIGKDRTATPAERQMGTASVTITIANIKLTNTSNNASLAQKEKAWSIWQLIDKVHEHIQGYIPSDNCGKLIRSGSSRIRRDDGIQEYKVIYTLGLDNV